MTTPIISAEEVRAYRDKHGCSMQEAKRTIAMDRLNARLHEIAEKYRFDSIKGHELVEIIGLLRIEQGAQ